MIQPTDSTDTVDAGSEPVAVTIGQATCTPTDRASIGVKTTSTATFQLYLDDTSQAYDCNGKPPACWCIGGGTFPLDTYDCQTAPR